MSLDGARAQTAELGLRSERALAFFYDLLYNQGSGRLRAMQLDKLGQRAFTREIGRLPDEQEHLLMRANRTVERVRTIPPAVTPFMRQRRHVCPLGRGTVGGITFDLHQVGFRMRALITRESIPLSGDTKTLQRLQSGWVPGGGQ